MKKNTSDKFLRTQRILGRTFTWSIANNTVPVTVVALLVKLSTRNRTHLYRPPEQEAIWNSTGS